MNPSNSVPTPAAVQPVPQQGSGPGFAAPQAGEGTVMPLPPSTAMAPPAGTPQGLAPQMAPSPLSPPYLEPPVPVHPTTQSAQGAQAKPAADATSASDPQLYVGAPAVADDGDVIEKEWVLKAKQIVERTRTDPHQQTKEMHAFKAEYMKKRYNKVIEPVEE